MRTTIEGFHGCNVAKMEGDNRSAAFERQRRCEPIGWWEWSRCDHSARAERAVAAVCDRRDVAAVCDRRDRARMRGFFGAHRAPLQFLNGLLPWVTRPESSQPQRGCEPIGWWEWSRCDHSARAERAARALIGPGRTKPPRRSARRDGSQREPFHQTLGDGSQREPFHQPASAEIVFDSIADSPRTNAAISYERPRPGSARFQADEGILHWH